MPASLVGPFEPVELRCPRRSEYGLPRPRRRPIRPLSTQSSHSSPSESKVGPRAASSARWSAPWTRSRARRAPRRGPSSSCARSACPRLDRVGGPARTACSGSAHRCPRARARLGVRDLDPRRSGAPPARHLRPWRTSRKPAPGGHRGTQMSETLGFVGVGRPHEIPREPRAPARKTANEADAGGGTRTPDTRIMILAPLALQSQESGLGEKGHNRAVAPAVGRVPRVGSSGLQPRRRAR